MTDHERIARLQALLARIRRRSTYAEPYAGINDMEDDGHSPTLPPPLALLEDEAPTDTMRGFSQTATQEVMAAHYVDAPREEDAAPTDPPPPYGPVFDDETPSHPYAIVSSPLLIDDSPLPSVVEVDEVDEDLIPSVPMHRSTPSPPTQRRGGSEAVTDVDGGGVSQIEEPPASSERPIADSIQFQDARQAPLTPPPESGRQITPPSRSAPPASIDVQPHHVQGAWREPGLHEATSSGPVTVPPPVVLEDPGVLVADVTEAGLHADDARFEVSATERPVAPATFGKILDAALDL